MKPQSPEWLLQRGGEIRRGLNDRTWLVLLGGSPQYQLVVAPAKSRVTCALTETVSGRRLDAGVEYPDVQAALRGGLEELRRHLGW